MTTDYAAERARLQAIIADVTDERPFSRDAIAHMREHFPSLRAQVDEYESIFYAPELLAELVAKHGARVEEIDAAEPPDDLDRMLTGYYLLIGDTPVLAFPRGQDPAERLIEARKLLDRCAA